MVDLRPVPCAAVAGPVRVAGFDDAMFAQAGVGRPASIMKAVVKRRAEFFYGRLRAQAPLAALGFNGVTVGTGAMREPLWPEGVIGSITHSGDLAAAIALPARRYRGVSTSNGTPTTARSAPLKRWC